MLKRDRAVVLAGLVAISALAWGYMVHEARAMVHTGVCQCAGMKMSGPDMQSWSASTLVPPSPIPSYWCAAADTATDLR